MSTSIVSPGDQSVFVAQQHALLDYASEFLVFVDRGGGIVLGAGDAWPSSAMTPPNSAAGS